MFHQNAQCLSNKFADYEVYFNSTRCDIVCISEHWYTSDNIETVRLGNFNLACHYSRTAHIHGGVAIFSAPHLQVEKINSIHDLCVEFHFEATACKFSVGDLNVIVLALYRSDKGDRHVFLEKLDSAIEILGKFRNHVVVICGDFNCDFLTPSRQLSELLDVLHAGGLTTTISEPTRFTRCLDNVCISENQRVYDSRVVHNALSDHHGQIIELNYENDSIKKRNIVEYRQINNPRNIARFKTLLAEESWLAVCSTADVDLQYAEFHRLLYQYYEFAFPLRRRNHKSQSDNGWITAGIQISSVKLKGLFLLVQGGVNSVIPYYKKYKTIYRRVIRAAKRMYYSELVNKSHNKVKTAWRIINGNKRAKSRATDNITLSINGENCSDQIKCANYFNAYFTTMADQFVDPVSETRPDNTSHNDKNFFLAPVTHEEVFREILRLKPSPSCGFDNLSAKLLRNCAEEITLPLTSMINNSFQSGVFPSILKVAKCIPLYKKNEPTLAENYRPLSILSTFSKLFEKLFCARLLSFFNQYSLFNGSQHGFRKGRSTTTAIIDFLNKLYTDLDKGQSFVGVFLDLSKAFDLVDHGRLLDKLKDYGVRGVPLSWLRSYLSNRQQYVQLGGTTSEVSSLTRGVPQGSVIGPLLYIIYTGDIDIENIVMYADDVSILSSGSGIEQAIERASRDVGRVKDFFLSSGLHLNAEKSVCVNFTLSVNTPRVDTLTPVVSDGTVIKFSDDTKFLGIRVDKHLKWSCHIDTLCNKIARLCHTIKNLKEYLNLDSLKLYYFAQVHSLLSYGVVAWGSGSDVMRVLILQKRALRYMAGVSRLESCRPLFRRFGIMTVVCEYLFQLCVGVKLSACSFSSVQASHQHNTRNGLLLGYPIHRTAAFETSPHYMSIRCFNKLPSALKTKSFRAFKSNLKTFLINKAYYTVNEFLNDSF